MKKYNAPLLTQINSGGFVVPAAPALVAGLAKGATVGVAAMLGVIGAKKAFGDIVQVDMPALEPCIN